MSAWLAAQAQGLRPESKLVEQNDAPILVTGYRAEYVKRTNDSPESIRHEVEYRNRSSQKNRRDPVRIGIVRSLE